jgi:hypothetical protein
MMRVKIGWKEVAENYIQSGDADDGNTEGRITLCSVEKVTIVKVVVFRRWQNRVFG